MCMLTVIPAGIVPDTEGIYNGTITNTHGHGFGILIGGRVKIYHDMNAERAVERFDKVRRANPEGPALFHSRWATHGVRNESNCHPFRIGGDRKTILAHNGVLPSNTHPRAGDQRSDTKLFAQDIFPKRWAAHLDNPDQFQALQNYCGSWNKLAIITANTDRYKRNLYIVNAKSGIWAKDGLWYSNTDYLPYVRQAVTRYTGTTSVYDPITKMWTSGPLSKAKGINANRRTADWEWDGRVDSWSADSYADLGGSPAFLEVIESAEGASGEARRSKYPAECPWCFESDGINPIHGSCERCGTCLDCVEPLSVCMCYVPESAGRDSESNEHYAG